MAEITRRTLLRWSLMGGAVTMAGVAGCSSTERSRGAEPKASASPTSRSSEGTKRVLLAYFSRAGENYYHGDRIDLEVGNTRSCPR